MILLITHRDFKENIMGKQFILLFFCLLIFSGCAATYPKNILKVSEESLNMRIKQMRQYETNDETLILAASAGVLQDLGFVIESSETKLGFISSSKDADATSRSQVAGAFFLDMLSAVGGSHSNYVAQCDDVQKVKASLIVKSSQIPNKIVVRITFQRIVWNKMGLVSRVETVREDEIYLSFFEKLSKSIFLEEYKI